MMNCSVRGTPADLPSTDFGDFCAGNYLSVNITVPSLGAVVVAASVVGQIERSSNNEEIKQFACLDDGAGNTQLGAWWNVERNSPPGLFINAFSAQGVFVVSGSGTYTFTLKGGGFIFDFPTAFLSATMIAVFYPAAFQPPLDVAGQAVHP